MVMVEWRLTVCGITRAAGISSERVYNILHNIWAKKSFQRYGCRHCSQLTTNEIMWRDPKKVYNCYSEIHRTLVVDSSLCSRRGYDTIRPRRKNGPTGKSALKLAMTVSLTEKVFLSSTIRKMVKLLHMQNMHLIAAPKYLSRNKLSKALFLPGDKMLLL